MLKRMLLSTLMLTVPLLTLNSCCSKEPEIRYVDRYVEKECPIIVLPPESDTSVMDEDVSVTIYPL